MGANIDCVMPMFVQEYSYSQTHMMFIKSKLQEINNEYMLDYRLDKAKADRDREDFDPELEEMR